MEKHLDVSLLKSLEMKQDSSLKKWIWISPLLVVLFFGSGLFLGLSDLQSVLFSFHFVFVFFMTLFMGGLFFLLIQHATASGWSVSIRRIPEVFVSQFFWCVFFFLPSLIFAEKIFKWLKLAVGMDALVDAKRAYLNYPFFLVRSVCYFVILFCLSRFYSRQSFLQDQSGDSKVSERLKSLSYPSIFLLALTITFFSIDMVKSLDPHWYSTMFGVYIFAGSFLAFLGLTVFLLELVSCWGVSEVFFNEEHRHDLGKLLFGFSVFWTYIAFSQFFLIWYANIPEGTLFFAHRWEEGWSAVSLVLIFSRFIFPFFFLLPRTIKRNRLTLLIGGLWIFLSHALDLFWLIMPNFRHHVSLNLTDVLFFLGGCVFFLGLFLRKLFQVRPLPIQDPRLEESLSYDHPL